jgi:maleylpyruvate isomerase
VEKRAIQRDIERDIARATAAHARLLDAIEGLTDDQARAESLLPGWTVGHVLTHLARNADSHVRLIDGASAGEVWDQYVGGVDGRVAEIEAGAHRPAAELVADVRASNAAIEARWADASELAWTGEGLGAIAGPIAIADLPFRRWREVEVHHVDLGLGHVPADWPGDYVRIELARQARTWASRRPMGLTDLPAAALALAPHDRLAWLLGRLDVADLEPAGIF